MRRAMVLLIVAGGFLHWLAAEPPTLQPNPASGIREQDLTRLSVSASDPEGAPLTYHWTLENDPTGHAFFLDIEGNRLATINGSSLVRLGLADGPSYPEASFPGQVIQVRVEVSDGVETASHVFSVTVTGVNKPPVISVDKSQLGTPALPRLTGEGVGLNSAASYDPDGGGVKFLWQIASISGGWPCETALVLLGKETTNPGLIVPQVSAYPSSPMRIVFRMLVEDGLIVLQDEFTGYMASERGCQDNEPPRVEASASPSHAAFGQTVTLNGSAVDPGDSLTFSWVQLDVSTAAAAVALSNPRSASTSFTAPSAPGLLTFKFTATDSANQSASATVNVEVSPVGGEFGGGGPGGGDPGGNPGDGGGQGNGDTGQGSGEAAGAGACDGQEGNQPAVAALPALFTIDSGNPVRITASNAADPDDTKVFVSGQEVSGVSYQWELVDGADLIRESDLDGVRTDTVSFDAPLLAEDRSLRLAVTVSDAAACGTRYVVEVQLKAAQPANQPPEAVLTYRMEGSDEPAGVPPDSVTAPATIFLDGGGSSDEGPLTYRFDLEKDLATGDASLDAGSGAERTLRIEDGSEGELRVTLTVTDEEGLSASAALSFAVASVNRPPVARLRFQTDEEEGVREGDGEPLQVAAPVEVRLDAGESSDDDELKFAFTLKKRDLLAGGAVLRHDGEAVRILEIQPGSRGAVTVVMTVTDSHGQSDSVSLDFQIQDAQQTPVAALRLMVDGREVEPGASLDEGTVAVLDASDSRLPDGGQPHDYQWKQLSGPPVNLVGGNSPMVSFRVPEMQEGDEKQMVFELVVSHAGAAADPVGVEVPIAVSPIFFGQVAFGPLGDQDFRTVFLLLNARSLDAQEVRIDFFGPDGQPMAVGLEGEPWEADQPFSIPAGASRRLRFTALDPNVTQVGWARLNSDVHIEGLVLYQLVNRNTGQVDSEISLFSSPRAEKLSTFFAREYEVAAAVVNPGAETVDVRIELIDEALGPEAPIASKVVTLEAGGHTARFLDEEFFGSLPETFQSGTLVIEPINGSVVATLLKTRNGVALSTLPTIGR